MSEMHYCDRCKKELGEADSHGYIFKRRAWMHTIVRDVEFCSKCADEVWLFMNGEKVDE